MADSDDSYYKRKIIKWIKKPFWIHRKADMIKIKEFVKSENEKHMTKAEIDALAHNKVHKENKE